MSTNPKTMSNTRRLQQMAEQLGNELRVVNDEIYDIHVQMNEQGFDGEFDPTARLKADRARLAGGIDALYAALSILPDDRTEEEKREDEDAAEDARYEAAERHTRWEENGRPVDGDYYGGSGDD